MFSVVYSQKAIKSLSKMNPKVKEVIVDWIEKNLIGCSNPRKFGKALVGNHAGEWRYRVGDYRIISRIEDEEVIILILNVGHRKRIY